MKILSFFEYQENKKQRIKEDRLKRRSLYSPYVALDTVPQKAACLVLQMKGGEALEGFL
jgi:hypothetical protein